MTPTRPLLLTIPDAAAEIGIHRNTLYRKIAAGEIEAIDIAPPGSSKTRIRVPRAALEAWAEGRPRIVDTSDRRPSGR
ncbi:helix-turn-helix domain-containing protein [Planobispora siamensis]|uniref:Helix-turn-helix domain-containing protein n=1 Tax=Planobispora siamensis TaxID=936338 RepID=A0A8J3SFK0_9ACTN|nr:helix-turn-helix domain-containing protein [Planobispora siamensis]GIH91992.1 hypothetical protein Psi01_26220 [Planobispora siamensis]